MAMTDVTGINEKYRGHIGIGGNDVTAICLYSIILGCMPLFQCMLRSGSVA